jgi:polygalacturonase
MKLSAIKFIFFLSICVFETMLLSCRQRENKKAFIPDFIQVQEFNMPVVVEPSIPDNTVYINDFGAVNDGQTLNTNAFKAAINAVSKKGGGKVVIPKGIWLTGPIILKSNINLNIEEGALLIFSPDKDLYPLIESNFEGKNTVRCTSPIYGKDLENISITGKGVFDGNGQVWRPVKKEKLTESQWKELIKSGGIIDINGKIWYPSRSYLEGQNLSEMNVPKDFKKIEDFKKIKDFLRPVMVSLVNCKKILLDGPVFQNSPAWCLHPLLCEDLTIRNITVRNPWFSQNGDGLDIESCKNSIIYSSNFDVGDDAICIKSGKDADGRKRGKPTENLVIRNCIVYHGHGGVTVGSEMSGGVKNVYVSGCTFIGTDVGLRFKSNRGRGGVVENIFITDIKMINIPTQAISFNLYYGGLSVPEMSAKDRNDETTPEVFPQSSEETPVFKNISIKNVTCKGASQAIFLQGLPEMNLENVLLEDITMETKEGLFCMDANGIKLKNIYLKTSVFPVYTIYNSKNIYIQTNQIFSSAENNPVIVIKGSKSENITMDAGREENRKYFLNAKDLVDTHTVHVNFRKDN